MENFIFSLVLPLSYVKSQATLIASVLLISIKFRDVFRTL